MALADREGVGVDPGVSAWDVFVSYAHADVDVVSALVFGLREAGLSVWWDRDRIDTFDGITSRLEEGIAGARVVVMCLSETYPSRPACQWEALQVLRRLPQGEVAARLLPVAVTPGAGLSSWPILSDLRVPDAVAAPVGVSDHAGAAAGAGEADWAPVVWAVRSRLQALPTGVNGLKTTVGAPRTHPVIWLPERPAASATFTGRFAEMLGLHSRLASDKTGLDSGRAGVRLPVSVVGIGGVGKTMLVQEYVNQFSGFWPVVIKVNAAGDRFGHRIAGDAQRADWLDALAGELRTLRTRWGQRTGRTGQDVAQEDGTLATSDRKPSDATDGTPDGLTDARDRLDTERSRFAAGLADAGQVLWWVDDIPDGFGEDLPRLLSPVDAGATVFTSRSTALRQTSTELPVEPFEVSAFDDGSGAGVALLAKHRPGVGLDGHPKPIPTNELAAMRQINRLMGGLPLALAVTGARVGLRSMPWPTALKGLRADPLRLTSTRDTSVTSTGHTPSVVATFASSLAELAADSPEGMRALIACTLLGPGQPIPKTLLVEVLTNTAEPLDEWNLGDLLDRPLRMLLLTGDDSSIRVHELIAQVARAEGHLDGVLGEEVRDRIATLATDPAWVVRTIPTIGLSLVTQVLNAHDPKAPLTRIVRTQTHNLSDMSGHLRASRTTNTEGNAAAARIATLLSWEALRQGHDDVYSACRVLIEGSDGLRYVPLATTDRTDPRMVRILTREAEGHAPVALAPDGRMIAVTGSRFGTLATWDVLAGSPAGPPIEDQSQSLQNVALTTAPDGRILAIAGYWDGSLRLWDLMAGTSIGDPLNGHKSGVMSIAVTPTRDERIIAVSGDAGGTAQVWDVLTGTSIGDFMPSHNSAVESVAVATAPDGRVVAITMTAWPDRKVQAWDAISGRSIGDPFTNGQARMTSVALKALPDERLVAAIGSDDHTQVWDVLSGAPIGTPLTGRVESVAIATAPDGRLLAVTGNHDGTVGIWDVRHGAPATTPLTGHTSRVESVAIATAPDGRLLAVTGSHDRTVRLWDVFAGTSPADHITSRVDSVEVAALPGGRLIAVTDNWSARGQARIWDGVACTPIGAPLPEAANSTSVAIASDGRLIAIARHTAAVFDVLAGTPICHLLTEPNTSRVDCVAAGMGPDERLLAVTGTVDGVVRVWDVLAGTPLGEPLVSNHGAVESVAVLSAMDGRTIAVSRNRDGTVFVWDVLTGATIGEPIGKNVRTVAVGRTQDGRIICATADLDGMVHVWDVLSGDAVGAPLANHSGWLASLAVAVAPSERLIVATGHSDGGVRVWDVITGTQIGPTLSGATAHVESLAAATQPDGRFMLAAASGRSWTTFEPLGV